MGWDVGYDTKWKRDIGYGVPSICDHRECLEEIDRGLSYVCGGEPYGGEKGCGLYFCIEHLHFDEEGTQLCEKCIENSSPFEPKPDTLEWVKWKLTDESWELWRNENPEDVVRMENRLKFSEYMDQSQGIQDY